MTVVEGTRELLYWANSVMTVSLVYSRELLYHTLSDTKSTYSEQHIWEVFAGAVIVGRLDVLVVDTLTAVVADCPAVNLARHSRTMDNIGAFMY